VKEKVILCVSRYLADVMKLAASRIRSSASAEIVNVGNCYAVQGHSHSRSLMLVPIESLYVTSCY